MLTWNLKMYHYKLDDKLVHDHNKSCLLLKIYRMKDDQPSPTMVAIALTKKIHTNSRIAAIDVSVTILWYLKRQIDFYYIKIAQECDDQNGDHFRDKNNCIMMLKQLLLYSRICTDSNLMQS